MDADHSNAYAVWQKMGSPARPTATQFVQLQRAGQLASLAPTSVATQDGRVRIPLELKRQGVMLVRISW